MSPEEFRALFPALSRWAWLDTPASPPGARPVVQAQQVALEAWLAGDFAWQDWDGSLGRARDLLAAYLGVPERTVALMGSVAEGAATVAATLPPGRVVVSAQEFRSNLFPWLSVDPARHEVVLVPPQDGSVHIEDLVAAVDDRTVLLAVSEVLALDGSRADLPALRQATDRVGARLFVDATQSLGALRFNVGAVWPDYLAVHGYKWLLCPRGAAWLVVRDDRHDELRPLLPSWRSTPEPREFYGGPLQLAPGALRCDTSPAWFSWIGTSAALRLHLGLDPAAVERHCVGLASMFREGAQALGARLAASADAQPSHIAVVRVRKPEELRRRLARQRVQAAVRDDRLRVGFHYFNNDADLDAALAALPG
jgi:selenocysteine lyase/cysteine desulfurase